MNHPRGLQALVWPGLVAWSLAGCAEARVEQATPPASVTPAATGTRAPLPPTPGVTSRVAAPRGRDEVSRLVQKIAWLRSTNPYGHTAIKIQSEERVIYLDPVDLVDVDALPKADIVLVTHDHGDHFSPQTLEVLSKEDTRVVSIEGVVRALAGWDAVALAPGQTAHVDGVEVEGISARNASHPGASGYLGFVLCLEGVRIYCSGDTGLTPEMESLADIDIAVLNVRKPYALSGRDVVRFAGLVKPAIIIPLHWMPEDDTYHDREELEYVRRNMPGTTRLAVLEMTPRSR